jgi:hypothetical protein
MISRFCLSQRAIYSRFVYFSQSPNAVIAFAIIYHSGEDIRSLLISARVLGGK